MANRGIEVRPDHYYNAALENIAAVSYLRGSGFGNSAIAAYLSGLSAECAFRALIPRGTPYYNKHVFVELAKLGALRKADATSYQRLGVLINNLSAVWRNALRFYSNALFESWCRKRAYEVGLRVSRRVTASAVVCKVLFDSANDTVLECQRLWLK